MRLKLFSNSTPESEFDNWFSETHNGSTPEWELEEDADEVEEDDFSDNSWE
jgi:hypothetical protein